MDLTDQQVERIWNNLSTDARDSNLNGQQRTVYNNTVKHLKSALGTETQEAASDVYGGLTGNQDAIQSTQEYFDTSCDAMEEMIDSMNP